MRDEELILNYEEAIKEKEASIRRLSNGVTLTRREGQMGEETDITQEYIDEQKASIEAYREIISYLKERIARQSQSRAAQSQEGKNTP